MSVGAQAAGEAVRGGAWEVLPYSVHSCSSYSGDFSPDHILVNRPKDQKSRWLSDGSRLPQHITVVLSQPAIACSVVFGKFEKSHACNLRRFSVYGGMDCEHMHLLCEGGLTDNSEPEQFSLRHEVGGHPFPCRYLKVVPLQSWGPLFAYSIWYLELRGVVEEDRVREAEEWLQQYCKAQAVRLCLKHLRDHDFSEAFESLSKQSRVELEHPLLSQLHTVLVSEGDFESVEKIMAQAMEDGFLDIYIQQQPIQAQWTPITPASAEKPGMRGGHQMCIDPHTEVLYLFGGWDGSVDLADLWKFSIRRSQWTCLCSDTTLMGGPSGRSCHKMCLDSHSQVLYLLGRYLVPTSRTQFNSTTEPTPLPGDFYSYCIDSQTWRLLSSNTHKDGGPHLIYDHQMTFDPISCMIYVFGGRVLTSSYVSDSTRFCYSGLYTYNTTSHTWSCIRPDFTGGTYSHDLIPRMAHTLLLHPGARKLYVLGGQRDKQPLSDMLTFDLQSDEVTVLADGKDTHIPASGFTIRTSLDPHRDEIHLLTGLNKFEDSSDHPLDRDVCSNSLWVYSIPKNKWTCIFTGAQGSWAQAHSRLPSPLLPSPHLPSPHLPSPHLPSPLLPSPHLPTPRYAHQFTFDPVQCCHYMFGGNPGAEVSSKAQTSMRLDDFWRLKLVRQSKEQLLRLSQLAIRKQHFAELAADSPVSSLNYLQTHIAALVDHTDPLESAQFRQLTCTLFSSKQHSSKAHACRQQLYAQLACYFPEHMTQPRDSILDMVKL